MDAKTKHAARVRRHKRGRRKVSGTAERPRLAVYRSNRHIYAQLIDDRDAVTQGHLRAHCPKERHAPRDLLDLASIRPLHAPRTRGRP